MWVYIKTIAYNGSDFIYQVGFYHFNSEGYENGTVSNYQVWSAQETYDNADQAAQRVNYLNGGNGFPYDLKPPAPGPQLKDPAFRQDY